ncbi:hypothetical protein DL770_006186 [Monosporascus sp. CRB-9-2]|nr:hypothetical protein DL770_006186 [Monosporascus sp. CRB-9-2]
MPHRLSESSAAGNATFVPGEPGPSAKQPRDVASDPIALVGMSCRLPGGINSSSKLWEFLREGRSGQCEVPRERFNVDAFYHPNGLDRPGSMTTRGGYFLQEDPRLFDPDFFNIIPLEAAYMDPQQRKLLEVVYEAFESAGATLDDLSGANVGCYVGNFTMDYQTIQTRDPEYLHRYVATGMGTTILANRISHVFNLKGPSLVLDTACSSSLYSLHVACAALDNQECDAAIVAGVNLIQSSEQHIATMKAGVLSKTSTCHTFSNEADGYGRAEGVGCLYLKRLSDAIRNNDPIRAIIPATAVNSNGRTPGITQPSSTGQELVIRKAYQKAGFDFTKTAYIECHGTGTPVGDPIEVEGVSRVFGASLNRPLLIGSVKPNVGHSEAASGITGIIKAVLSLENGKIPATIGVDTVNPEIKTREWNVEIVTRTIPWPEVSDNLSFRRTGINSFGYGGANAHVILESAQYHVPSLTVRRDSPRRGSRRLYLLPVSANNATSLENRVQQLNDYFSDSNHDIINAAYTLGVRRTHFPNRGCIIAEQESLGRAFSMENLRMLPKKPSEDPRETVFIFTGQGAQWPQMGKSLYHEFPIFTRALKEMDSVLRTLPHAPEWSLKETIFEPEETSKIHDATRSQPVCTAIQVALVILLESWGITPSVVVGHSSGEIAAAFAAGFLSASEAITTAYYRGYIVGEYGRTDGAMLAAGLSPTEAEAEIQSVDLSNRVKVACINSPENVTISGDSDAIDLLTNALDAKKIFARKLLTNGRAYHCHHTTEIGARYEALLAESFNGLDVSLASKSNVRWISTVTGEERTDAPTASYWRTNLESPVMFADAMRKVFSLGHSQLIEIGPHSALQMPIKQIRSSLNIPENSTPYVSALSRKKDDAMSVLGMVGDLYLLGLQVSWAKVNDLRELGSSKMVSRVLTDLPPYPWTYGKTLWHEPRSSYEFRNRKYLRHELLGSQVPGGNGIEIMWRNKLKLADLPWLPDHKLEATSVLPGAAYIAMAVQAAMQATSRSPKDAMTFRLEKVSISTALPITEQAEVEVFTTLRPRAITSNTTSKDWYDFSIMSYQGGVSTTHATGSVSCTSESEHAVQRKCIISQDLLEPTQPRVWYSVFKKVGLNFGPSFRSVEEFCVSRARTDQLCSTRLPLLRSLEDYGLEPEYVVHPITIDAMVQTALAATTSGNVREMTAKVPVKIGKTVIRVPQGGLDASLPYHVDAKSSTVGFGASSFEAELCNAAGDVVCQLQNVKMAPYNSGAAPSPARLRHPMLRVQWKPDPHGLGLMPEQSFKEYVEGFAAESKSSIADKSLIKLGAALHIVTHKNPVLRVLELGSNIYEITNAAIDLIHGSSSHPQVLSWTTGHINDDGELHATLVDLDEKLNAPIVNPARLEGEQFDLVFLPVRESTDVYCAQKISALKRLLAPGGLLLGLASPVGNVMDEGFNTTCADLGDDGRIILAQLTQSNDVLPANGDSQTFIIGRWDSDVTRGFEAYLKDRLKRKVHRLSLHDISEGSIPPGSTVFSFLEAEKPLLSVMDKEESIRLKRITDNSSNLVWVTSGNLLSGSRPEFGLAFGLSRAVMMEQPSTRFYVFDVDNIHLQTERAFANLVSVLDQDRRAVDFEFVQRNGVVHVSRFVPDEELNIGFRQRQGDEVVEAPLGRAKPAQLTIGEAGSFDTLHFKQITLPARLGADDVQVSVTCVGLNAKDYYALAGKVDTKDASCTLDFCGVVERVGAGVSHLSVGDRVVVMAPGHFRTSEIVPSWACQKLLDGEPFDIMSTLPMVFSTALYALRDRARLQAGETVLIHSAAGGVGIAAIQIAQWIGAEIYATVSNDGKANYLVENFQIKRENIFSSRDTSFLADVLSATGGRGVDVVLNSLTGELLHASWRCCASFGRFVELGKRDLVDFGKLDMDVFLRNTTFTAFDMTNMYYDDNAAVRRVWARLLADVVDLFRREVISSIKPLSVFDVSDVRKAMRYFSSRNRMGKVVVALEKEDSWIPLRPMKYSTTFSPDKTYILIGCLGGLGRSLSRWMTLRGARKFVFLGRSGANKPAARALLQDLKLSGCECTVVTGDVCIKADVEKTVAAVEGKIGGVVQAAMGLSEALFTTMTNEAWHKGIDPKVHGTWHLHETIKGKDDQLEFFLMTSSISGSVGTATESNYCAGNFFLDLFARYRRSLGLPATTVGLGMISEVGYLHENPEIERLLLRKGIQPINEDEMLQIIDMALSRRHTIPHAYDGLSHSHILTGLELSGLQAQKEEGFEGTNPTLDDPRAAILRRALGEGAQRQPESQNGRLPVDIMKAMESGSTLREATMAYIARRFSNLILLPLDRVDLGRSLSLYGMDSMIAAEFRSWIFQVFKIDVPFLELMSKRVTLTMLNETIVQALEQDVAREPTII